MAPRRREGFACQLASIAHAAGEGGGADESPSRSRFDFHPRPSGRGADVGLRRKPESAARARAAERAARDVRPLGCRVNGLPPTHGAGAIRMIPCTPARGSVSRRASGFERFAPGLRKARPCETSGGSVRHSVPGAVRGGIFGLDVGLSVSYNMSMPQAANLKREGREVDPVSPECERCGGPDNDVAGRPN